MLFTSVLTICVCLSASSMMCSALSVATVESWLCGTFQTYRSRDGSHWAVVVAAVDIVVLSSVSALAENSWQRSLVFQWTDRYDWSLSR